MSSITSFFLQAVERPVQPISEITQPRHNELPLVQTPIPRGGEDGDARMVLGDESKAFGGGDHAEEAQILGAGGVEGGERFVGGAAGGEHWVKQQHGAAPKRWELAVVVPGSRRCLVALEADAADGDVG